MAYRTSDPESAPRLSDRQLTWIVATSSEAEVRANLRGISIADPPSLPPDELGQVLLWLGLAFFGAGLYVQFATTSRLALLPSGLGLALLAGALVRWRSHAKTRRAPPNIEVVTLRPVFEDRVVKDHEGEPISLKYMKAFDATQGTYDIVWPSKLHPLTRTLGDTEQLRIGILRRGNVQYVAWAYPV